jgi:ATP-dependent DNA ligase
MRPTLAAKPFSNPAWLFEPKWDGWRTLCFFRDGKAHLLARRLEQLNVEGMRDEA